MSNPVGESLPEPDPEPSPYQDVLFHAHDNLNIYPPYPQYVNASREFEVRLFDDYDNIEVEASIYGSLVERYLGLRYDERFDLANHIELAIGRAARTLIGRDREVTAMQRDTVVLINNLPVMFEPINNAMLVGQWEDWDRKKMNIRSQFIESREQQRLLLGGLASFVTYLEQR